jgi:hypothetical protein
MLLIACLYQWYRQSNKPSQFWIHQPVVFDLSAPFQQRILTPSSRVVHEYELTPSSRVVHEYELTPSCRVAHEYELTPSSRVVHEYELTPSSRVAHEYELTPSSRVVHEYELTPQFAKDFLTQNRYFHEELQVAYFRDLYMVNDNRKYWINHCNKGILIGEPLSIRINGIVCDVIYVDFLCVAKTERSKGIAEILIKHMINRMADSGKQIAIFRTDSQALPFLPYYTGKYTVKQIGSSTGSNIVAANSFIELTRTAPSDMQTQIFQRFLEECARRGADLCEYPSELQTFWRRFGISGHRIFYRKSSKFSYNIDIIILFETHYLGGQLTAHVLYKFCYGDADICAFLSNLGYKWMYYLHDDSDGNGREVGNGQEVRYYIYNHDIKGLKKICFHHH